VAEGEKGRTLRSLWRPSLTSTGLSSPVGIRPGATTYLEAFSSIVCPPMLPAP
jgi:hypothetical protein